VEKCGRFSPASRLNQPTRPRRRQFLSNTAILVNWVRKRFASNEKIEPDAGKAAGRPNRPAAPTSAGSAAGCRH
jgi:hypothetical protein